MEMFMKAHDKGEGNGNASKSTNAALTNSNSFMKVHDKGEGNDNVSKLTNAAPTNSNSVPEVQENSSRRKTSKYFPAEKQKLKDEEERTELPVKRKVQNESSEKPSPLKKPSRAYVNDDYDEFVLPKSKNSIDGTPSMKLKSGSGKGVAKKAVVIDESDEDDAKDLESPVKFSGKGRGGKGASTGSASGKGRGGGQGGFMNFGEKKDPPHKGEKEVPEGASNCLAGLTFVISGTLDSLEREETEDLIKCYGGRIT